MKLSVITVCKNDIKNLAGTISSIESQTYQNIEYIIVDGSSTDGTVKWLEEINAMVCKGERFFAPTQTFQFISEPDTGIYHAMNKGIKMATGEVVYFLNSGDILFDRDVVNKVVKEFEKSHADFVFGDTIEVYETHKKEQKYWNVSKLFLYGDMICHQACFFKKSLIEKVGFFNEAFKITADF